MDKITALILGVFLLATSPIFAQQIPAAAQVSQLEDVHNKTCPVSGDAVAGSKMGDKPVTFEYNGKLYHLCCPMCIKDFKKNPEKYSKIAEDEIKAGKKQ